MTPEAWTIAAVGIALLGLGLKLDSHVRVQGEKFAKLEGKVDTLIAAFVKPKT